MASLTLIAPAAMSQEIALSDATSSLFSGSANCAFCHDQWGRALRDQKGGDVSIAGDWRATMMAHSFKDPLWRARMEAEVMENPQLRSFIEDKCQTCHAPMARTQARQDGTNELAHAAAKAMPLAGDGVSCTLCHQIQPAGLGKAASFSGHYAIKPAREIFGPYQKPVTMPMVHHVDYTPKFGQHVQTSELCATCHTLFTPIFDPRGKIVGQFPEQTPFLEWKNSAHARENRECQDCHMPRLDEPIKISARPPWVDPREPFWRHQFAGGNAFMLALLSRHGKELEANASPAQFERMMAQTTNQLRRAAALRVNPVRKGEVASLEVEVENLSGHKLPTGYPYRRAWLHVKVTDAAGRIVFESGAVDASGQIIGSDKDYEPHHDEITRPDQVQIYEAVMGDQRQQATRSLLRAQSYLKDNRLPPRGFTRKGKDYAAVAIRGGAEKDDNFSAKGSGRDRVTYRITPPPASAPLVAEVELLYQPIPPESVRHLLESSAPEASRFAAVYGPADKTPVRIQQLRVEF